MSTVEPDWADREFVFVAGMHRSGTTLLAKLISSAAGASGLDSSPARMGEGQFLQDIYPTDRVLGGVTVWANDARSHLTESDVTAETATRLWKAWSPYWAPDAKVLVEKTPSNLTKLRFLQTAFPRSRLVVITRHPISYSMAIRKWSPSIRGRMGFGFSNNVRHWLRAHEIFQADSQYLANLTVLSYEELLQRPGETLTAVLGRLGLSASTESAGRLDRSVLDAYAEDWVRIRRGRRQMLREPGWKRAVRRGAERVTLPIEALRCEKYRTPVSTFGYDLDDLRSYGPWLPHSLT